MICVTKKYCLSLMTYWISVFHLWPCRNTSAICIVQKFENGRKNLHKTRYAYIAILENSHVLWLLRNITCDLFSVEKFILAILSVPVMTLFRITRPIYESQLAFFGYMKNDHATAKPLVTTSQTKNGNKIF